MAIRNWDYWNGQGADGKDYCQSIYELAQYYQPKLGLEIGVRFGKSALATLLGSPNMELIGVDPNPEYPVEEFLVSKVGDRFTFINAPSPQALSGFDREVFDWIYIDGRHDYDGVLADFATAWPLLKKGGVMVFDDYDDELDYDTDVKEVLYNHTYDYW
jgi:predicted O-methyltransferase YrrM